MNKEILVLSPSEMLEQKIHLEFETLSKSKALPVGTIRQFGGKDYVKTEKGWRPKPKGGKPQAQFHYGESKSTPAGDVSIRKGRHGGTYSITAFKDPDAANEMGGGYRYKAYHHDDTGGSTYLGTTKGNDAGSAHRMTRDHEAKLKKQGAAGDASPKKGADAKAKVKDMPRSQYVQDALDVLKERKLSFTADDLRGLSKPQLIDIAMEDFSSLKGKAQTLTKEEAGHKSMLFQMHEDDDAYHADMEVGERRIVDNLVKKGHAKWEGKGYEKRAVPLGDAEDGAEAPGSFAAGFRGGQESAHARTVGTTTLDYKGVHALVKNGDWKGAHKAFMALPEKERQKLPTKVYNDLDAM